MSKKKIAILLPYKETYTDNFAGAASIWLKDYIKKSKLSNQTIIYGNIETREKPLTENYKNIPLKKSFLSKTKSYMDFFYRECLINNFEIIEIHNRPEYLKYLIKRKINSKILFFFHNNPLDIKGSKTINERNLLLEHTHKIFFVSRWVKEKFFEGLKITTKSNCEITYPSIDYVKNFNKNKKKQIIFTGKLNSSKGYDIFGEAILKILDKYPKWNAVVAGNEPREKYDFKHKNLKIFKWLPHRKILDLYKQSSISVVPSKWEEPFGRTSMESAAYGCATITSNKGGLTETFNNNLILKKLSSNEIFKIIEKLILNPKLLRTTMFENFKKPLHILDDLIALIDSIKINILDKKIYIGKSIGPKILHISNFNEKNQHRLFNISIASKLSNGLIRNNCDVINFSYRNFLSGKILRNIDQEIIDITKNYRPDLVLFGHNNILNRVSLEFIKERKTKTALWYEDHVANYGPNWESNLKLIEENNDLIDRYFITTHPSAIKSKIKKNKLFYLPIPVDKNIENLNIYENKHRYKDLFFALSHGVNFGGLRKKSNDERENFLQNLINMGGDINFHILGINNDKPKWNYDFYKEIGICKMALNLSRGKPLKYATSNRIASYMGNGILTFINSKVRFQELFNDDEMIFYNNEIDLIEKINLLKNDTKKINKISKNGKRRYFKIFENKIVSNFILSKTFDLTPAYKYAWK